MERSKLLTRLSLKNGLIIGIVVVVMSIAMHVIDPMLAFNSWASVLTSFVVLGLFIYSGLALRKEAGGFWTFSDAFKSFLIMSLIICVMSIVYNAVLMGVIDPELPDKAGVVMDEKMREVMSKFATEEQVNEAMEKNGGTAEGLRITPKNMITSFGVMLAMYGVLSIILAAILKKQQPVFIKLEEDEK